MPPVLTATSDGGVGTLDVEATVLAPFREQTRQEWDALKADAQAAIATLERDATAAQFGYARRLCPNHPFQGAPAQVSNPVTVANDAPFLNCARHAAGAGWKAFMNEGVECRQYDESACIDTPYMDIYYRQSEPPR